MNGAPGHAATMSKGCKSDKDRGGVTDVELKHLLITEDMGGHDRARRPSGSDDQQNYYGKEVSSNSMKAIVIRRHGPPDVLHILEDAAGPRAARGRSPHRGPRRRPSTVVLDVACRGADAACSSGTGACRVIPGADCAGIVIDRGRPRRTPAGATATRVAAAGVMPLDAVRGGRRRLHRARAACWAMQAARRLRRDWSPCRPAVAGRRCPAALGFPSTPRLIMRHAPTAWNLLFDVRRASKPARPVLIMGRRRQSWHRSASRSPSM